MNAFLFWIFIYSHMYCYVVIFIDMYSHVFQCITTCYYIFNNYIEFGFRHLKNYGDRGGCYLKSQIYVFKHAKNQFITFVGTI